MPLPLRVDLCHSQWYSFVPHCNQHGFRSGLPQCILSVDFLWCIGNLYAPGWSEKCDPERCHARWHGPPGRGWWGGWKARPACQYSDCAWSSRSCAWTMFKAEEITCQPLATMQAAGGVAGVHSSKSSCVAIDGRLESEGLFGTNSPTTSVSPIAASLWPTLN